MEDDRDDAEPTLSAALTDLVQGEEPSPELRARVAAGLPTGARRTRPQLLAVAVAAALVVAALVVAVLDTGSGDDADLATAPDETTTTLTEPEVLGERVERRPAAGTTTDPSGATATTEAAAVVTTVAPPPTTAAAVAPPASQPAAAPTTAPCRNSTDPACGPFRWEPTPQNEPATLTVTPPDGPIVAGEQVELLLEMTDPDGKVTLACYTVNLDRPGLATGSCASELHDCPERYGAWTPPPPQPDRAESITVVEFHETGTYTVEVDVTRADGCDNVDPYRSGARTTITVEVVAA